MILMSVMEAILQRKSIRAYQDKPIEQEKLEKILEAGRLAPSATNQQAWKFVVVTDPALRHELVAACRNQAFVEQAPVVMVLCADEVRDMACGQPARTIDCSIALSYMQLQAAELGIGSCWLGAFSAPDVAKLLKIPAGFQVVAVSPFGYPAEEGRVRSRKPMEDIVRYDAWETKNK